MERRVLFVIFSCFLVLYLWNAFVVKPVPRPATTASGGSAPGPSSSVPPTLASTAAEAPPAAVAKAVGTAVISDSSERDIRIETSDVIAVFTNRGGRLKSWRLKHYLDQDKQPQELVVSKFDSHPLPFSLQVDNEQNSAALNAALYRVNEPENSTITAGSKKLRFEYSSVGPALHVVKEFDIPAQGYIVTFNANVTSGESTDQPGTPVPYAIAWGPAVGDLGEVSRYAQKPEGLLAQGTNVLRPAAKDFAKQPIYEGDFRYAGVDDNYFMTVALSLAGAKIHYQPVSIPPPANSKDPAHELVSYSVEPGTGKTPIRFFVGPKDFDVLAAVDQDMTRAINFGMFAIIVVPLLRSLKWVHGYVGNYGWSIVILTILINAIMFPLRHKSAVSMRKMQQIQPEMKSIQDRYAKYKATDPKRQDMNKELMALYRDRGVNPASGCVPMLLTMPVFLAMWALLQTSIELRGAPWFGWIHDLSSHDRFYVLPIIMVASQFWQQRMMPAAGADPAQQKMMMFMPAVMGFIFIWLPAGALIYYVISNLWAVGQQYLTNRLLGPPNVRTVRPAAERRMKRVGTGKTEGAGRES